LHIDASNEGLGVVLYQKQGGIDRVIAYASRSLRGAERLYPAHKREFLALKWAVTDKFHEYLYGSKFVIHTRPIESGFNQKQCSISSLMSCIIMQSLKQDISVNWW
jgi:hypothetical protein